MKKKVAVIGLGYVGLPLALAIERSRKYEVVGFDISDEQIKKYSLKNVQLLMLQPRQILMN